MFIKTQYNVIFGTGQKSTGDTLAQSDILAQKLFCNFFSMLK